MFWHFIKIDKEASIEKFLGAKVMLQEIEKNGIKTNCSVPQSEGDVLDGICLSLKFGNSGNKEKIVTFFWRKQVDTMQRP